MSGAVEITGIVLATLGTLEQATRLAKTFRDHCKAFKENLQVFHQLLNTLDQLQKDLQQLHSQLKQSNSSGLQSNHRMVEQQLKQIATKFQQTNLSLSKMNQSTSNNLKHFFKASKLAEECQTILKQLNEAQQFLYHINFFLGNITLIASSSANINHHIEQTRTDLLQAIESQAGPSPSLTSGDVFQPYTQKLPISVAAEPDFLSIDSNGNHLTIEGIVAEQLLDSAHLHTKVYSILGPGGVGKTTTMHMLTHDQRLRDYFCHGTYYLKLGADAKVESAIERLADIVQKCGGISKGAQVQKSPNISAAMVLVLEWFMDKKYLFLVDDFWEQKDLGVVLLSSLKNMITTSNNGGMVFTTRDPAIATEAADTIHLNYRDPQGTESRKILFQHARQSKDSKYGLVTEEAIATLLKTCGGLPVAHSIVGKGVLQYSLRRNVGKENAWRLYAQRQHDILQSKTDGYDCLYTVFKTAINLLNEEESETVSKNKSVDRYCYEEMYRSLCVLEKQQGAPIEMLKCLWNIYSEDEVRKICINLERVGLAELYHEELSSDQGSIEDIEAISMHDLLHEFATKEAKREDEIEKWHGRITKEYGHRIPISRKNEGCREWWESVNESNQHDGGYFLKNICRHLYHGLREENEVVILVTRPEWIGMQMSENGLLQYERDMQYACEWIGRRKDVEIDGDIEMKEIEMISDAVRLSASYICKNSRDVWFQLYGRLMRLGNESVWMSTFLEYLDSSAPRPWIRPIDGLLTDVRSAVRSLVDVGSLIKCMAVLPGQVEVLCGCNDGRMVIVNLKESIVKKQWKGHNHDIKDINVSESGKIAVSVSEDGAGKIWDVGSWAIVGQFEGVRAKRIIAWISKDDNYVFTAKHRGGTIVIWEIESGTCVHVTKTNVNVLSVMVLLRNEDTIVTNGNDKTLLVWKVTDQRVTSECEKTDANERLGICQQKEIDVHSSVICISVSNDATRMVVGFQDGSIQIWNTESMSPLSEPWTGQKSYVSCVSFSNDGTKVVSGFSDNIIQVREVKTGSLVRPLMNASMAKLAEREYQRFMHQTRGVSFFHGDNSIVSHSWDGMIRTWKTSRSTPNAPQNNDDSTGHEKSQYQVPANHDHVLNMTCTTDESRFVLCHEVGFSVWDAMTGKMVRENVWSSSDEAEREIQKRQIIPCNDGKETVFVRCKREIRYGNESNSVLLCTLESKASYYAYSSLCKVLAVYFDRQMTFLRVAL